MYNFNNITNPLVQQKQNSEKLPNRAIERIIKKCITQQKFLAFLALNL